MGVATFSRLLASGVLMTRHVFRPFLMLCLVSVWMASPVKGDYKQAVAFYNQGRCDKAIQELKPDLDRNPDWEFGHRLVGLCYLKLGNNALAVSSLSRAVQLKSTALSTYFGLGQAYFNMQRYDNSIAALNQGEPLAAKERDPNRERGKVSRLRGTAYFRLSRFNEALPDLTNAIRMSSPDWTDYSMLGICYLNTSRTDEGIETLEKSLSMKPGQSAVSEALGKAYLKKGASALAAKQYVSAVQSLLKAKDHDPNNGYVFYNLGEAYLFQKRYGDAEKVLTRAVELMPGSLEAYVRMGLVYEKQRKWDQALKAYKRAEGISPSKGIKESIARVNENKKQ